MTNVRLGELKTLVFARSSSHDIIFEGVRVKQDNQRKRRGTYEFVTQLCQIIDGEDDVRILEMRFAFQPYREHYFIHHVFETVSGDPNSEISEYLKNLQVDRNYIKDETRLNASKMQEIRDMILLSLANKQAWTRNKGGQIVWDNGKGRIFIKEIGYV